MLTLSIIAGIIVLYVVWIVSKRNTEQNHYTEQAEQMETSELKAHIKIDTNIGLQQMALGSRSGYTAQDSTRAINRLVVFKDEVNKRNGLASGPSQRNRLRFEILADMRKATNPD